MSSWAAIDIWRERASVVIDDATLPTGGPRRGSVDMIDLDRLRRIRLTKEPLTQKLVGGVLLNANYNIPPGNVKIEVEGVENLPDEPIIFAMNHPDRYNYFPFQYWLWRNHDRLTATWVKGKYYEQTAVGAFMEWTNQLPTVSRGYIIAKDFMATLERKPTESEYDLLRAHVDANAHGRDEHRKPPRGRVPGALFSRRRDILGRPFDPSRETYAEAVNATFRELMKIFVGLHEQAFDCDLDLLIFPQGTRSIRLSRGHIGLAQIALRYQKTVVPVGCNGSERIYPSDRPWAKPGRVVYRIGEPIPYGSVPDTTIDEPYAPFTAAAEGAHRETFQRYVDYVMDRINELLDPEYQWGNGQDSGGVSGTERFL